MVTAGTGGIGLETALGLARAGHAVTVVGRNVERGNLAVERINAGGGEPAQFLQADLALLDDVRRQPPLAPPGGYYGFHRYGRAKLANLAYTLDLARRLEGTGVTVFAADPGGAATDETLPTGTLIGAQDVPVTPIKAATDPRVAHAVRWLSERCAPLVQVPDGISN